MQLSLADINTINKPNGKTYYYHRKTNARILGAYGSPEFLASYLEASKKEVEVPVAGTFTGLLLRYKQSAEFLGKRPNTKRQYEIFLAALRDRFGKVPLKRFEERAIKDEFLQWRDEIIKDGRPATARNLIKFSQTLLGWAEERGILDINRLRGTKQLYKADRSGQTWEAETIQKILSASRPEVAQAILLALWTSQRQGDLVDAKWEHIQDGSLIVTQGKTGAVVGLPVIGGFKAFLDSLPRASDYLLNNHYRRPWAESSLRWAWQEALKAAELETGGKTFHDLRGTALTALADMGATEVQIAAISGHAIAGQARTLRAYLRRTYEQAKMAMEKLEQSWIGKLAA